MTQMSVKLALSDAFLVVRPPSTMTRSAVGAFFHIERFRQGEALRRVRVLRLERGSDRVYFGQLKG
jgi:hypothetical protein